LESVWRTRPDTSTMNEIAASCLESRESGQPTGQQGDRLPSLDGLRAISIFLVVIGHLAGTQNFLARSSLSLFGDVANLGVRVFFLISGFLITDLLLKEFRDTGRLSLKNFYMRRILRIFPAFYCYIGVITLAAALGWVSLTHSDLLYAMTYTMNHHYDASWCVGHLWSLAVEEQFYLLWPFVLVVLGRVRGFWAAGSMLLIAPVARVVVWYFIPSQRDGIGWVFPTIADALATGCLLAGLRHWLETRKAYMQFLSSKAFVAVPICLLLVHALTAGRPRISYPVGQTIVNIAIAVCIHRCVWAPRGIVGRFLNWGPTVLIGSLSYSIYIWQQPFLNRGSDSLFATFPLNIVMVALAASASHFLIEQPFLGLRRYFRRRPTTSTEPATSRSATRETVPAQESQQQASSGSRGVLTVPGTVVTDTAEAGPDAG
jgi:peptidoglycan/LPS O-acetylase OafA/YrhL